MSRRFLIQFGVTTALIAFGGGAAFADGGDVATAGATAHQIADSVISFNGDGDSVVSVTTMDTQTTTTASTTQSTFSSIQTTTDDTNGPVIPVNQMNQSLTTLAGDTTEQVATPSAASVQPTPVDTASKIVIPAPHTSYYYAQLGTQSLLQFDMAQPAHTAIAEATQTSVPTHPTAPPAPLGLLGQLRALLNGSVVPTVSAVRDIAVGESTLFVAGSIAFIILLLVVSVSLTASFVAHLRRTGYQGAARSDVGGATWNLITPQQMGCTLAKATW